MAVIQIPIGGRAVPIEVPNFAMEDTQQSILSVSQQIRDAITGVEGNDRQTQSAINDLTREVASGNQQQRSLFRNLTGQGSAGSAAAGFDRLGDVTKAGDFGQKLFDSLGFANIGVQFGMVFGTMEQLGEVLNKVSRVGVNFGDDLLKVQDQAAGLGLTLDQFGKIVGTQGSVMKGLGDNTEQGSRRFLDLATKVREGTRQFGFFGTKSDEMAMILADELEVRRQTIGTERLRNLTEKQLTEQMTESLAINEAMARLTGQDVQERRKASLEARRSAIAQSFLSEQSVETQRRFEQLAGSLSALGPQGKELSDAILTGIATGMDPRVFAPQLIARLGDGASELIDYATSAVLDEGINVQDFAARSQELALEVANTTAQSAKTLRIQAAFGDSTAETILAIKQRTQSIDNFGEAFDDAIENIIGNAGENKGLRGLSSTMDQVAAEIKARTTEFAIKVGGGDLNKLSESVSTMADSFLAALDSQAFKNLMSAAGTVFGETAFGPIMRQMDPSFQYADTDVRKITDKLFTGSLVGQISGVVPEEILALARAPTNINALLAGMKDLSTNVSPQLRQEIDDLMTDATQNPLSIDMSRIQALLVKLINAMNGN
jgi:hypothetical protein